MKCNLFLMFTFIYCFNLLVEGGEATICGGEAGLPFNGGKIMSRQHIKKNQYIFFTPFRKERVLFCNTRLSKCK